MEATYLSRPSEMGPQTLPPTALLASTVKLLHLCSLSLLNTRGTFFRSKSSLQHSIHRQAAVGAIIEYTANHRSTPTSQLCDHCYIETACRDQKMPAKKGGVPVLGMGTASSCLVQPSAGASRPVQAACVNQAGVSHPSRLLYEADPMGCSALPILASWYCLAWL